MRLLFSLFLLPIFLFSQTPITEKAPLKFQHKYKSRLGIVRAVDYSHKDLYTLRDKIPVGLLKRSPAYDLSFDWQPWQQLPFLRFQGQLGYYESTFNQSMESSTLLLDRFNADRIEERAEYNNLQLGFGVLLDPLHHRKLSPYFSGHLLLAVPTYVSYEVNQLLSQNAPGQRYVEGGGRLSPGWKMGTGLRLRFLNRAYLTYGVYYIEQDLRVEWPRHRGRIVRNKLLSMENTGVQLGLQLAL